MHEWPKYWWSSVTGPRNLCEAVSRALHGRNNVCLIVPDDLPWRWEMRGCIENEIKPRLDRESFCIEFIDVADQCPDIDDVGKYLLNRFAPAAVATGYRGREKIQKYILSNHVLSRRLLWINGMNARQEEMWLRFCRDYAPENESDSLFVLEARCTDNEIPRRNLAVVRYRNLIQRYDLTLFDSIYLSMERSDYGTLWQQYAAVAAAQLCGTDAEVAQTLMDRCDFRHEDPIAALRGMAEDDMFSRRGQNDKAHILNLVRREDTADIERLIWKAQLQLLFPLVEIERSKFVRFYYDEIQSALREKYIDPSDGRIRQVYQFGELLDEPENAELGTIYRMTRLRCEEDYYRYLLYIPDEASRARIELLHTLRNALAHGKCCDVESVAAFIDAHPFAWK